MKIKDMIQEKHEQAENTLFFKTLLKKNISKKVWINFIFNKMFLLKEIESKIDHTEFKNLSRIKKIQDDILSSSVYNFELKKSTIQYINYIKKINDDRLFAHVYVWYLGDLSGGQIIKKILPHDAKCLDFVDSDILKSKIMNKISIDMIDEINLCFDWVIKILNEFEKEILQESN